MLMFNDLSIKHKLTGIIMSACSLMLLLTCAVFVVNDLICFRREMIHNISTLASVIGVNSTAALTFQYPETATEILEGLSAEPYIIAAYIYTDHGEVFAEYINNELSMTSPTTRSCVEPHSYKQGKKFFAPGQESYCFSCNCMSLVKPIILNGKKIGSVYIRTELKGLYSTLKRSVSIVFCIFIGFFFLAYLISSKLQKIISDPISTLAQTMKNVSSQKNFSIRIENKSKDEIGILIDGFNKMLRQIQAHEKKLNEQQGELEKQVAMRTAELKVSEQQKKQLSLQKKSQRAYGELLSLINSIDISQILERSLNRIVMQVNARWGGVYLCREEGKLLPKTTFSSNKGDGDDKKQEIPLRQRAQKFAEQVFNKQHLLMSESVVLPGKQDEYFPPVAVGYPLMFQKKCLGVLVLIADGKSNSEDKNFLENTTRQLSIALHNALTFQELQYKSAQLEQSNQELARASQMKSDFLANMSHELRTPLNAIIGFSEVLTDKYFGELNETQEEYIGDILESGKHLLSLINDILDLSKIEAGKMEFSPSDIEIKSLLSTSLNMIREKAVKHSIKLSIDVDGIPEIIQADERKVKQIVFNLLSNAIKFTPDSGKIQLNAEVVDRQCLQNNVPALFRDEVFSAMEKDKSSYIKVSVTDTGIGIKPESLKKVFEVFLQEESPLSRKHNGTGLGLSLCKKFLKLHKGTIWVESRLGEGSTFSFVLPVESDNRQ